jgi:hypothetical protein
MFLMFCGAIHKNVVWKFFQILVIISIKTLSISMVGKKNCNRVVLKEDNK